MSTFAAGSLTQLVAKGALDMYLTSNPESTFWKSGFSRCTAFSMEAIMQQFPSSNGGASSQYLDLTRTGDLLYTQYLMINLPGIQYDWRSMQAQSVSNDDASKYTPDPNKCGDCVKQDDDSGLEITHHDDCLDNCAYAHYTNAVGQYIVNTLDILIGSQHVDTLYGDFMFVHEELCGKVGRRLLEMIGKRYTREELIVDSHESRVLYVPLPFWYTLSSGSALPLAGLQFHSVRYQLSNKALRDVIVVHHKPVRDEENNIIQEMRSTADGWTGWVKCGTNGASGEDLSFDMLSTYVYLDDAERSTISNIQTESLIVQHQRAVFTGTAGANRWDLQLPFNHPVIELIWFVRNKTRTDNTRDFYNLGSNFGRDPIKRASLKLNNQLRFGTESGVGSNSSYFRLVQPYQAHSCIPDTFVYCYSFALHPEDTTTPSGSANFSRIDKAHLELFPTDEESTYTVNGETRNNGDTYEVSVFATNWNIARLKAGLFGVAYSS